MTRVASRTPAVHTPTRSRKGAVVAGALVLAGLVIGGVVLQQFAGGDAAAAEQTGRAGGGDWFTVEPRSFDLTVVASGELESTRQVEIKSEVQGESTIVFVVDEGTAVEKGDLLVKLSDDDLRERMEQETLSVEEARMEKIAAEQNLAIGVSEAQSAHDAAELKLALAELALEKWRQGELVQKRNELELALDKATRQLKRAREDVELGRQLYADDFISRAELDDDELALVEAEAALRTAELNIEVYEKYTYPQEEKQFLSDVEQAKAELERTITKNESDLSQRRADLESRTRRLRLREERLEELERQYAATEIRAPQPGMVVYATSVGRGSRRDSAIQQGTSVRYNETILLLPDTRQMSASLRVHEAMIPMVRVGQTVSVTIDARPRQPIEGKVAQVAVMAEDGGWWNPQLREYKVRVDLPAQAADELKPAMRCVGQIMLGRVEDALAVPIHAVHTERNSRYCYLPAPGNRVRKVPVKIGRASETYVEITEGLKAGDHVLVRRPRPEEIVKD